MKITNYQFGNLSINNRVFNKDVVLSNTKVFPNWRRKEGHKLYWQDIAAFVAGIKPEVIIVGQGKFGMMTILPEVINELNRLSIKLIAHKTSKAVVEFNARIINKNVLGAFHLTC